MTNWWEKLTEYGIPKEYEEEFSLLRLKQNIKRAKILSWLIIIIESCLLITTFIPSLRSLYGEYVTNYRNFFGVLISVASIFVITVELLSRDTQRRSIILKILLPMSAFITIISFIAITLIDQYRGVLSYVNLFIIMAISVVIIMKPIKSIILFTSSHFIFLVMNHVMNLPNEIVFSNYVNMTFVIIIVCVISYIFHRHQVEGFMREKVIKLKNEELTRITMIDPLTNLYNRRSLDDMLQELFEEAKGNDLTLAAMMIDIDYFKEFNDTYGHVAGDEILVRISKHLKEIADSLGGYGYRYGGDEFLVVIKNMNNIIIEEVADKLRKQILYEEIPHEKSKISDYVTISIGAINEPATEVTEFWDVISEADTALYEMKKKRTDRKRTEKNH